MIDLEDERHGSTVTQYVGLADMLSSVTLMFMLLSVSAFALVRTSETDKLPEKHKSKRIIIPNEVNGRVFFDSGSAMIRSEFEPTLDALADQVIRNIATGQYARVEVHGHTDIDPIDRTCYADNWDLGAARAVSVVRYFISRGLAAARVEAVSHGQFAPADHGGSAQALATNRRIEIRLIQEEEAP